jgi:uncharacterized membrane protein
VTITETRKRSWMKSITWRIAGILILGAVTYGVTRDVAQTTGITFFFHALRFALYYWHERIWDRIDWGRITHPLADLRMRPNLTAEDHTIIRTFLEDQHYLTRQPNKEVFSVLESKTNDRSALAS